MRTSTLWTVSVAFWFWPTTATASEIVILNPAPIETLDTIDVKVTGFRKSEARPNKRYWVTLVAADTEDGRWAQWFWVDSSPAEYQFRPLSSGSYELRVHDHISGSRNDYTKVYARLPFSVTERDPGNVSVRLVDLTPIPLHSPITVAVSGMDPALRYWVTVVPATKPNGRWGQWRDLDHTESASVQFDGLLPGEYEVRVHDYRADYALLSKNAFSVSWDIGPDSVVPSCPYTFGGAVDKLVCQCDKEVRGTIWGTDYYTTGSSPCLAAKHTGVIDQVGDDAEAIIVITTRPGAEEYRSEHRNGIASKPYGRWNRSFTVGRAFRSTGLSGTTTDTGSADLKEKPRLLSRCKTEVTRGAASSAQRARVLSLLNDAQIVGDGVDGLFDTWLSQESYAGGVVWWDVFGLLLTTLDALEKANDRDISGASGVAARAIASQVAPQSTLSSTIGSANSVAGLAGLPIEWSLTALANEIGKDAIENQILLYFAARDEGWSHSAIMRGQTEYPVVFANNGYITRVDTKTAMVRIPFRTQITRDELYEMARILYESDDTTRKVDQSISNAIEEFWGCVSVPSDPTRK